MFVKIDIQTRNKVDLLDITEKIQTAVRDSEIEEGVCYLFCPHTTAGLILNENWDASVRQDIKMVLERIVPDDLSYRHREGNSPAHIKAVLVGSDHFLFVQNGELQKGQWQGIFFAEFDGPRHRNLWIRIIEDESSG